MKRVSLKLFALGLGFLATTVAVNADGEAPASPPPANANPLPFVAVGINPVRSLLAAAEGLLALQIDAEVRIVQPISIKLDLYTANAYQANSRYSYLGLGLSTRWYFLGQNWQAPTTALSGFFAQLGVGFESWSTGAAALSSDGKLTNVGLIYGAGWKYVFPGYLGFYLEPLLAYRSSFGASLGSGFYGGLGLGVSFAL